jgi:hypothetical protein
VAMLLGLALALACAPAGVLQVRVVSEMLKFLLCDLFVVFSLYAIGNTHACDSFVKNERFISENQLADTIEQLILSARGMVFMFLLSSSIPTFTAAFLRASACRFLHCISRHFGM